MTIPLRQTASSQHRGGALEGAQRLMGQNLPGTVPEEVERLVRALAGEMSRKQLLDALGMTHREHFRRAYLKPALEAGVVEMTLPDKPNSSNQRYRLTSRGQHWLEKHPTRTSSSRE